MNIDQERADYENHTWDYYQRLKTAGWSHSDEGDSSSREALFWRASNGQYGVRQLEAAWQGWLMRAALAKASLAPVVGDVLPAIGSHVFIRHGRDDDAHACIVTGYYGWGDLGGDRHLTRVFVRLVYEGTEIEQARLLCECYPTAEAALAA